MKQTDVSQRPKGPMIDEVQKIMFEFAKERIAAAKAREQE